MCSLCIMQRIYGAYGVMVNTGVCGTKQKASILHLDNYSI